MSNRLGASLSRMTGEKEYHGDLEATAVAEMLSAGTPVEGSQAYVAMEAVIGTLGGRRGSFILQHTGLMTRGSGELNVVIVPDSASDELTGLAGKMAIRVEGGKHFYDLEYTMPE